MLKHNHTGRHYDHDCMDHRVRGVNDEGDDVLVEFCNLCGRTRHESDGVRPMAWFVDPSNPTGHHYAYPDPHNDGPSTWKYVMQAAREAGEERARRN